MRRTAFVGGWIFDSAKEAFIKANLLCEDGFIADISQEVPFGYEVVRVDGKYLIPGLVDVHTHGIGGYDFNEAKENEIPFMCSRYARMGTTSIMATLASDTLTHLTNSIFAINQNRLHARNGCAHILGIHLEGRYLNPEARGAHAEHLLAKPNAAELSELASAMMPHPIHASVAPEVEGGDEFIKKANELGVTIGIAHTTATYEQAMHALAIGARSFTHTYNAMSKIHHRMPGAAVAALTTDDAYAEVIADGFHSHPAMVKLAYKSKPSDKLVLITDSIAAACMPDGTSCNVAGLTVSVKDGCAVNEFGVIAGSTLSMFKALTNFMKFCDVPLNEALKYATVNPANMVKADSVGRLEKSYRADFIIIDDTENPRINTVYVGGMKVI